MTDMTEISAPLWWWQALAFLRDGVITLEDVLEVVS